MAHVAGDYPLYYDVINEKGLGMAGLNFVGNAASVSYTHLDVYKRQLGNIPILMTFRTSKEGGEKAIEPEAYAKLNRALS